MKATLKNFRQSPRKVRLVADVIRGKKVSSVLEQLQLLNKKSSAPILALLKSALQGSVDKDVEKMVISEITVDQGIMFKRFRARAQGRSAPIRKKTCTINLILK